MPNLPISDRTRLANITSNALHLASLDAVWTAHAAGPKAHEIEALDVTISHMEMLLAGLAVQGTFLSHAAEKLGETHIASAVAQSDTSDSTKAVVQAKAERDGGYVAAIQEGAKALAKVMTDEREDLRRQINHLRTGTAVKGDLSGRARCIIGLICICSDLGPVIGAGVALIAAYC